MLFGLFLTLGVAVLSIALRSYQNSYAQKAGALGILVATFLAIYFITASWVLGIAAAVSWLFLPWLEILTRIRALRLPKEKQLRPKSPPSSDTFPALREITREIEDEGFVYVVGRGCLFFVLVPPTFVSHEGLHGLDNLELPVVLRLKTFSRVSDQSATPGSILLAA